MTSTAPVTGYGNHYFQVTAPFPILVKVGLKPAHVFVGRAQALQDVYEAIETKAGDEIHALVGGDFLVRQTSRGPQAYTFDTREFEAWEIMLHPAPPMPKLPTEGLREIPADQAIKVADYRGNEPTLGEFVRVLS